MFDGLDKIFSLFETIWNFVAGFIEHINFVFVQMQKGFTTLGLVVLHMPDLVKIFVSSLVAFSVIITVIHLGE